MKKLLPIFFIFYVLKLSAQPGMYRHFPQTQAPYYYNCEIKTSIKTSDGGYVFSYRPWAAGMHALATYSTYTIKTDSNFVPQWKNAHYSSAIPLPTGGIILLYYNSIEKITASGISVWTKQIANSQLIILNDGVCFSDKIRLVGRINGNAYVPNTGSGYTTSQAYTLLIDTMGNFISHSLFNSSMTIPFPYTSMYRSGNADFSKIERDSQGNFFVYSNIGDLLLSASDMTIAKFDPSFTFLWGKTWASLNQHLYITDIDFLPSGNIFATGMVNGNTGALLKLNSQGNLLDQKFFPNRSQISGLLKKPNGNYIVSSSKGIQDSLFMFETDTAMNISWYNCCGRGLTIGTSIKKNNTLFTPTFYGSDPVIISNDTNGNSCASYSLTYTKLTSSVSLTNFTLSPTASSAAIVSGTSNAMTTQVYVDSCKCPSSIYVNQNNLCVGNTGTISITGHGNLSWYSAASGNSFIKSGPHFVYSSNTPTTITVYAQDSTCGSDPTRTQVNITVHALPTLAISPLNPTICPGSQIFVSASGATNYTWSGVPGDSYVQHLSPTITTNYTVTGSVAPSCSNTTTFSITVVPLPTLSISPPSTICLGSIATMSVSGAISYTWNSSWGPGNFNSTFTTSPSYPGTYIYTAYATTQFCNVSAQTSLLVSSHPTLSLSSSSSTLCTGKSVTITAIGAATYSLDGTPVNNSIVVTPSITTTYSVLGSVYNTCSSTQTISLAVSPSPTLVVSPTISSVCVGATVTFSASGANTYSWSNGLTSNTFSLSALLGTTIYTIEGFSGVCSSTATSKVYSSPVPIIGLYAEPDVLCEGKTMTISAIGAHSYTWSNQSNNSKIIITPLSNTGYTVTGTVGNCSSNQTINVLVYPNPTISVSVSNQSLCAGENLTLLASGAQSYTWNNGSNLNIIYTNPVISTTYSLAGLNSYGCVDTKTTSVFVYSLPVINLSSNRRLICKGEVAILSASGAITYSWSNGSNSSTISVSPPATTVYSVLATDQNGCLGSEYYTEVVGLCTSFESSQANKPLLSIFPNPTQGSFNVTQASIITTATLEVYNTLGQIILTQKMANTSATIDLKNYASGVYYIKTSNSDKPIKIIKE